MASEEADSIRVGDRVEVKGKDQLGTVKFYGSTEFAPSGLWIGVALDEPRGKNNGTVQGREYFRCPDNHGLFVRPGQVAVVKGPQGTPQRRSGIPMAGKSGLQPPRSKIPGKQMSPGASPQQVRKGPKPPTTTAGVTPVQSETPKSSAKVTEKEPAPVEAAPVQQSVPEGEESSQVKDLTEKLAILQHKRQEDKARIKELERYKAQCQQLLEYKQKWSEAQNDLQQQLKASKKEAKEAVEEKKTIEDEMRDLSDAIEMATLDKEMAEEKSESLQIEVDALKEKVEELTLDLDILRNEISESGVEGAASNFQMKQLEQQNQRLKEALVRLRDLSAQDKSEYQQVVKDLEKQSGVANQLMEQKARLQEELQEAENIIDELKEQVDASLGAEEMVETLTEKKLDLEEKVTELQEQVDDLEALKELSEEQEELRAEMEHELREELDLSYNKSRELERRIEASQEVIVDLQQTVEKFRELVRNQQSDIVELKQKEESQKGQGLEEQSEALHSLNRQLQATAIKAHSRTIEFELRKLEAQQAAEHIKLLKSFMPNSFLASGGDYDVLMVIMLLPRILFKAELINSQLRQQYKFNEVMEGKKPLKGSEGDRVVFAAQAISKLTVLQYLVKKAQMILETCDVALYRQMGGLRDDLALHEKALDLLIDSLKTEQLDESAPLGNLDKAISHFKNLLDTRLGAAPVDHCLVVLEQMKILTSASEAITMEIMRVRSFVPDGCVADTQLKDFDSLAFDLRVVVRKVRRRIPNEASGKTLHLTEEVFQDVLKCADTLDAVRESMTQLKVSTGKKGNTLSEGELLQSSVVEDLFQQVSSTCLTLVKTTSPSANKIRASLEWTIATLNSFASAVQNGSYDQDRPKTPTPPYTMRAAAVKSELSDAEGLGFKLEEKNNEIVELKKTIRLKGEEVSESGIRIALLEKKVEFAEQEGEQKAEDERKEIARLKEVIEQKDTRFERAINVMQNDIDSLEREKLTLMSALEEYKKTRGGHSGVSAIFKSLGKTPGTASLESASSEGSSAESSLLKEKVKLLKESLSASHKEGHHLRSRLAKMQMDSLPPLKLLPRQPQKIQERKDASNQTDQEKNVEREISALQRELLILSASPKVVDITKRVPDGTSKRLLTPQEQHLNQLSHLMDLQKRSEELKSKAAILLATHQKGGTIRTSMGSFVSPDFSQVLQNVSSPKLVARMKVPGITGSSSSVCPLVVDEKQWRRLHVELVK